MRRLSTGLSATALAVLSACSVPTEAPKYDTEWNVPGKSTSISVNSMLPTGVSSTNDNSAFQVTVSPASSTITRSLGQDCAACAVVNGLTVPKPAFTGGGTATVTLPATVGSATLVRDTLTVTITNGLNFDPLRPSAAPASARGSLVITIKTGGAITLGVDSIDGSALAMAPGSVTTRKIPLTGTVTGGIGLQVTTSLNSPLGDPVTIDVSRSLTVTGSTGPVFVSTAQLNLTNQTVTSSLVDFDLSGIDSTISKHADGGSLLLTLTNPFAVTGNLSITMLGGAVPVIKTIALATGTSTPTVTFSQADMTALLGHHITMLFTGTVTGSATITPAQVMSVVSRLDILINMGGR